MSVSLLEISGPIMVGPSSSHTAGALKLGQFARAFLGELPDKVNIYLHGSFGSVYKGHATDRAIIAGLLNFPTDSPEIINSFEKAKEAGMEYHFIPCNLGIGLHSNTAKFEMFKNETSFTVSGASVGGGAIKITEINGFEVSIRENIGSTFSVIVMHKDAKGVLLTVTSALSTANNNIASVYSVRTAKDGDAMTIVETDERIAQETLEKIKNEHPYIYSIFELN